MAQAQDIGTTSGEGISLNSELPPVPLALFTTTTDLARELVCMLKGEVGIFNLDRPVERDSRVVITVGIPGGIEPGELVFQVRIKAVMLRDGEFGCHAKLCDDKSRIFIARFLKKVSG